MSFLKRVSDTTSDLIIKEMLHARLGGAEPARSQQHIHSSDLTKEDNMWGMGYCPREVRLRQLLDKKRRDQFLQVATHVTFDEGRDKQKRLNEDWLRDVMWGGWVCRACYNDIEWGPAPPDGKEGRCKCGAHVWEYREPRIVDAVTGVGGGIDALVDVGKKKLRLVECKIMKAEDFRELRAPLSEHRVRTRLYLRLIDGSEQPFAKKINTKIAHVLYIMRGHGIKQEDGRISPFKEFVVTRDDSEVQHFLGMAHALKLSRDEEGLFPAGICATQMCDRAKKCPVSKECFSSKYPANITWLKNDEPVHTGDKIKCIVDGVKVNECSS
jgi:hypothetical protein